MFNGKTWYVVKEPFCNTFICHGLGGLDKMCYFCEPFNHNKNGIIRFKTWEICDETHHHKLHGSQLGNNCCEKNIFHRFVCNRHACYSCIFTIQRLMLCTLFRHECHMSIHIA